MDFLPYLIFMLAVATAVAVTTFGITTWVYVQGNKDKDDKQPSTEKHTDDRSLTASDAHRRTAGAGVGRR